MPHRVPLSLADRSFSGGPTVHRIDTLEKHRIVNFAAHHETEQIAGKYDQGLQPVCRQARFPPPANHLECCQLRRGIWVIGN